LTQTGTARNVDINMVVTSQNFAGSRFGRRDRFSLEKRDEGL
jgi:hypothetical protein